MPAGGKGRAENASQAVEAAGRGLLLALPLVLPFEVPLFRLGPLVITSAELVLYALLAAWGAGRVSALRRGARWRDLLPPDRLGRAVALWLAVVLVSALLAPTFQAEAGKSGLRALAAGLLFFAASDGLRRSGQARRVVLAVVAGGLLSALFALLELWVPSSAPLWRPFHATGFSALGLTRASGSFAYPTIAAMYWEAALPLVAALAWTGSAPAPAPAGKVGERRRGALAAAVATLLVAAILASATRAALVGAALASAAMVIASWRAGTGVRLAAGGSLAAVLVLLAVTLAPAGAGSLSGQRLRFWNDDAWYRARYQVPPGPLVVQAGEELEIAVTVTNTGTLTWPATGRQPVHLSHHWETTTAAGQPRLEFEGQRTFLPRDVAPGEGVALAGQARAPVAPGRYRLRWDLVREHVTWFSQRGVPTGDQAVEVRPATGVRPARRPPRVVAARLEDWLASDLPGRPELWRAAVELWRRHPVLGVGLDNFRRRYPEVIAPATPGRRYRELRLHANNLYLETLAGLGLVGLLALAYLGVALVGVLRARLAAGDLLAVAAAVGAGTYFVHGLLDYFFTFTPTLGLWWILLALARDRPEPLRSAG